MVNNGGGAATASGINFQVNVAAYFAVMMLAESEWQPQFDLPESTTLSFLLCETSQPTDDIALGTSQDGFLFVNCKRTVSLSRTKGSPLASVVDQFVRQFLEGVTEPLANRKRPIDTERDRFILAIHSSSPKAISQNLRDVLIKIRSRPDLESPEHLNPDLNAREVESLATFLSLLRETWSRNSRGSLGGGDQLKLLRLIHILAVDLDTDAVDQLRVIERLRNSILSSAENGGHAWRAIVELCRGFSAKRMGGDLSYFRRELENAGIELKAIPSYQADIERIRQHSDRHLTYLGKSSSIGIGDKRIKIRREIVGKLNSFADGSPLAIIGQPGAGKSGILFEYAQELKAQGADVVSIAADLLTLNSSNGIALDFSFTSGRNFTEILAGWTGSAKAVLIIDALDTARANTSLHILTQILSEIAESAKRWQIVISIREYDFEKNAEVQRLFRGKPHGEFFDKRFLDLKHIKVLPLNDSELEQVSNSNKAFASFLAQASTKLIDLIRNPFNLRLLYDLLGSQESTAAVNSVRTQIDLLQLYWNVKVPGDSPIARESILLAFVNAMVNARELHVKKTEIFGLLSTNLQFLDGLVRDGIIIEVLALNSQSSDLLGFSHNILFDFAVAKLWLGDLNASVIERLAKPENDDLVLAIRPSIIFAYQILWYGEVDHAKFWEQTIAIEDLDEVRRIGKTIPIGVAVSEFKNLADTDCLFKAKDSEAKTFVVDQFVKIASVHHESGMAFLGEGAADWAGIAHCLTQFLPTYSHQIRFLLWEIIKDSNSFTHSQAESINKTGRALIASALENNLDINFGRVGLEAALKTALTNLPDTIKCIHQLLEPDNLKLGGHEWVRVMCDYIVLISQLDVDLASIIASITFGLSPSREEKVSSGGHIMSFLLNKHDLFQLAQHHFAERYPSLVESDLLVGTKILISVVEAFIAAERGQFADKGHQFPFKFLGITASICADASYIWGSQPYSDDMNLQIIIKSFSEKLVKVSEQNKHQDVHKVLGAFALKNKFAFTWNILLQAAAESPSKLGVWIAELLSVSQTYALLDTCEAAGNLLSVAYPHYSREIRAKIEETILGLPSNLPEILRDYGENAKRRMLGCIPKELFVKAEAKKLRDELEAAGAIPKNDPDFQVSIEYGDSGGDWWLTHNGVDTEKKENSKLVELLRLIRDIPKANENNVDYNLLEKTYPVLQEVHRELIVAGDSGVESELIRQVNDHLTECCEYFAKCKGVKKGDQYFQFIRQILIHSATSPFPKLDLKTEESWNNDSAGWGSPIARISSAAGLMYLAANNEVPDYEVLNHIDTLSMDPVAAVRFQIIRRVLMLYKTDETLMWTIIRRVCEKEEKLGILGHFCSGVILRLGITNYSNASRWIWTLYKRVKQLNNGNRAVGDMTRYCAAIALWSNDPLAKRLLNSIISRPVLYFTECSELIRFCRIFIAYFNPKKTTEENVRVRRWATGLLTNLCKPLQAAQNKFELENDLGDKEFFRSIFNLAETFTLEIYFGSGAFDHGTNRSFQDENSVILNDDQRSEVLVEIKDILSKSAEFRPARAAYNTLQTLRFFVEKDPEFVIVTTARTIKSSRGYGLAAESMAADVAVDIVEKYISDYLSLIRNNEIVRRSILDILDIFVEVGWPRASKLTARLDEAFR